MTGNGGRALMKGIHALIKRALSVALSCKDTTGKQLSEPGRVPSAEPARPGTLVSDVQPPKL